MARSIFIARYKINNQEITDSLVLSFNDHSRQFPRDNFELYKKVHGEEAKSIGADEIAEMNKHYVGKKVRLAVYESGNFTGIPDGYHEYDPVFIKSTGFHFQNTLVITTELDEN